MVKEELIVSESRLEIGPSVILLPSTKNRRNSQNMRKYYQAALAAVALLSVVSLLIYRHEYNRLRYVLSVLNFYGKPGAKDAIPNCSDLHTPANLDLQFNSPLPAWQRLNDELFVYSAYRLGGNEITAIGFGQTHEDLNMECKVFFGGDETALGTFKHSKFIQSSEYSGYSLSCEYHGSGKPEAVSFFMEGTSGPILNVQNSPQALRTDAIALCVAPPLNRSISQLDMLSFLNFHHVLGVGHFIIYDYGVRSKFTDTVREIVDSRGLNLTFTLVPWNFPFVESSQEMRNKMLETDCLHRTHNKVEYSATLHWEDYLVLKFWPTLSELLLDFEKTGQSGNRYLIDTSVFCTQQKDDEKSVANVPIVFRKTSKVTSSSILQTPYVYISKPHKVLKSGSEKARKQDPEMINVHRYMYCPDPINESAFKYDNSILKFATDMLDATIYKEFVTRESLSEK